MGTKLKRPPELRARRNDSHDTRASKDFWWLVVRVEAEKRSEAKQGPQHG